MSDLLSIGASGVRAYQTALSTTSDNIANAGTAGYVRRTTGLAEIASGGLTRQAAGQGVLVTGTQRGADAFRNADVRAAGADLARSETGIVWLERIESTLNGAQVDQRLTAFFNAATALAADPSAIAPRAAMLEAAQGVAQAFTGGIAAFDRARTELDAVATDAASRLTSLSTGLAKVNAGIARAVAGTPGQAQLFDQRDQLLEEMSALTDIDATFDEIGRVSVRGGNASGPLLVHGDVGANISFGRNDEGAVVFSTSRAGVPGILSPNGGVMAGVADGAQRIADARDQLAGVAADFAAMVERVQDGGRDLDGQAGTAMFAIAADGTMTVALTDPRGIAAAGVGGGPRDNANLVALSAARATGAFEGRATALSTANGTALAGRKTVAMAQGAIRDGAVAARDGASGVNLDQEAVDLMRFQQAYQASSRIIAVARETLQTLFDIR